MERRVLFAIILSFVVLYGYQALVVKPTAKPGAKAIAGASGPSSAASSTPATAATGASSAATPDGSAQVPAAAALVSEAAERDIRVETRDVIAEFTNRGARLKSWRLKHYLDQHKEPQELVDTSLPSEPLPFTLRTSSEQITQTINTALYKVVIASDADVAFEYRDSAGVHASKAFHLDPTSYVLTYTGQVTVADKALPTTIVWGPAVGDLGEITRGAQSAQGLLFGGDGKVQRLATKAIVSQPTYDGDFKYAGVDDNYFVTAVLAPGPATISYQPVVVPPPANTKDAARNLVAYAVDVKKAGAPVKFFIGPKDLNVLAAIDRDFTRAINFGMFSVIVVPLLQSLKWINGYVGNWGWSIVLLTVFINALMFPLRHKSVVSMRKMQEIQPQVKAIQDRYAKYKATDPEKAKMNQEMMTLYREKGVNPASGCVPMLLQFPVLFAMWAMLSTAIELRGAPFFGWIHDLTAHDPFFVLPVLMAATQFFQTRLTPSVGGDPAQQKMMLFMPLIMGFMFLWLPAGALLYYVVGNLIMLGQTYFTNRLIGPPNIRTARPPAERRTKRVGSGKTEAATRES